MKASLHNDMRLAEEAADWVVRLMEEKSAAARVEFVVWLKRSPRHMEEFLLVSATHRLFRGMDPEKEIDLQALLADLPTEVVPFPAEAVLAPGNLVASAANNASVNVSVGAIAATSSNTSPSAGTEDHHRQRSRTRWLAAAAVGGLAILASLVFVLTSLDRETYSTGIGEQRAFRLDDGSLLHLNTRSRARVSFSKEAREVRLLEGEALFTVERDPSRPFRVSTRTSVVQAIGTQFNVYERADGTRVSVVEGRVKIFNAHSKLALLTAGEEASVRPSGEIARRNAPDVTTAIAWRQRRLAFHGATLAEVVEQFNRYNTLQLRIEGTGGLGRSITAVFNADEPEALLQFLERESSVQLERRADVVVIRPNR